MPILFAVDGGIARVTIDRPEVLNAIDATAERELQEVWATIERDRPVRSMSSLRDLERPRRTSSRTAMSASSDSSGSGARSIAAASPALRPGIESSPTAACYTPRHGPEW